MAIREKQRPRLSLGEPPKRRRLAYYGCSESAWTGFHFDGHSSELRVSQTGFHLVGHSGESIAYIRSYPDGYEEKIALAAIPLGAS